MNMKDMTFIVKKRLFNKKNLILIIALSIIFTAIFACITMMNFIINYRIDSLNNENSRMLIISLPSTDEEYQKINSINHIELIENRKFLLGIERNVPEFDSNSTNGILTIKALLKNEDVDINHGKNIENEGDVICPSKFYPHSIYIGDSFQQEIIDSLFLKDQDIINKTFKIESENEKYLGKSLTFNIVGTYLNKELEELNTCYVSKSDFDKLFSDYEYSSGYIDENGNNIIENYEYNSLIVRVDNYKNIDEVINSLTKINFPPISFFTLDEQMLNYMTYIPLFICLIIAIICVNIIYSFFKKKNRYNSKYYGILKSQGYTNQNICQLEAMEGLSVYLISIIVSLIFYAIVFVVVQKTLLVEFLYNNYYLSIPLLYLFLIILMFAILIIFVVRHLTFKTLALSVQDLFGE